MNVSTPPALSGSRKAAILLSILGDEPAAIILRNLAGADLQRLTDEVANLGPTSFDVTLEILEEYQSLLASQDLIAVGGHDVATRLLVRAFGESNASPMIQRLINEKAPRLGELDAVRKASPQQLAKILVGESLETKVLVIRHLDSKRASELLMNLEPEARVECVIRLASLGPSAPEVAEKVYAILNRRLQSTVDVGKQNASLFSGVADLMNSIQSTIAREILESIEKEEPSLANSIRDLMFRFDDFLEVPERELRELMSSLDKKVLMIALKGATEDLRSHFYRTMSSRAVEMMKEDSEMMGPVRGKDVMKAQAEIVAIARQLESEEKIVLKADGEDEYVL